MVQHLNLLETIIDRVAFNDPAKGAYFFADEVNAWDAQQFETLLKLGFIELAQHHRDRLTCPECDEGCIRPIEVIPKTEKQAGRAIIVCNLRDDMGYISVNFEDLKAWHSSGDMFAEVLLQHIKTEPVPHKGARDGSEWTLGLLGGIPLILKVSRAIGLVLVIDKEYIYLQDLLHIEKKALCVDWQLIESILAKVSYQEPTIEKARRLLKRKNALKAKGKKNFLQIIKKEENIQSDTWLKDLIKMAENEGAETQNTAQSLQNSNWINNTSKNNQ